MDLLSTLTGMRDTEAFWEHYLPLLSNSIKVFYNGGGPDAFISNKGYGDTRGRLSWTDRCRNWYRSSISYNTLSESFNEPGEPYDYSNSIPIFENYAIIALKKAAIKSEFSPVVSGRLSSKVENKSNKPQEIKEMNTFKNTADAVMDKNKEAVKLAAKLVAGKTANSFFLSKLVGKLPWTARFFSRKKDITENPVAKMVAAQTAMTLVTHFAPDNRKLAYITEGMVQEALVDVTVNSQALERMIAELENIVTLPKDLFEEK